MWLLSLSSIFLFAAFACSSELRRPLDCEQPRGNTKDKCAQPIDEIVAVVPGASYIAKLACNDCPWARASPRGIGHDILHLDQILYLNVTLAHNNRSVLLNDRAIYPLTTLPTPPPFYITQFPSNFSSSNLSLGLTCRNTYCRNEIEEDCVGWCHKLQRSSIQADYLYTVKPTVYPGSGSDEDVKYWEITLDVIGGHDGYKDDPTWKLDEPEQKMLWMLVAGREANAEAYRGERDMKAASDLFGPFGEEDKSYEYKIVDLRLEARAYTFPAKKSLSIWQKIGRFFGNDVWEVEGTRFIYLDDEWGWYGKKGTLRNMFGNFVHWHFWDLFWTISASVIAGLIALFGIYKLFFWILQERQLSRWDGIDDVWDRLRREPTAEEEDALLNGGYRDDPDEGGSSRPPAYTDEPQMNKPLPDKPLPDKPLPAVPLIDA